MKTKIHRQFVTSKTTWPRLGAIIGTVMNTTETSDCSRAMRSPSSRSRMMAGGSTESPLQPMPWIKRSKTSDWKSCTSAQASAVTI